MGGELGEAVGWRRWSAILVGFVGVVLVILAISVPVGITFQLFWLITRAKRVSSHGHGRRDQ